MAPPNFTYQGGGAACCWGSCCTSPPPGCCSRGPQVPALAWRSFFITPFAAAPQLQQQQQHQQQPPLALAAALPLLPALCTLLAACHCTCSRVVLGCWSGAAVRGHSVLGPPRPHSPRRLAGGSVDHPIIGSAPQPPSPLCVRAGFGSLCHSRVLMLVFRSCAMNGMQPPSSCFVAPAGVSSSLIVGLCCSALQRGPRDWHRRPASRLTAAAYSNAAAGRASGWCCCFGPPQDCLPEPGEHTGVCGIVCLCVYSVQHGY